MEEIIKELREVAERCDLDNHYDMNDCAEDVREIAGRLEQVVAENATTTSTCKESLQVGNIAKMREALKYLRDASREFHHLILNSKHNEICDKYKYPAVAKISDAIANAGVVLAESPRNCDVGSAGEQIKRWQKFCDTQTCCEKCPCNKEGDITAKCFARWSQTPYEKEGEE